MTKKIIKASDVLGNNYYIYELRSSNYTPALNGTITITCTVTDVYGDSINNKSITLYQNDTSVSTQTTNSSGVATWSITCSTAGLQIFSIKDTSIEVFVDDKASLNDLIGGLQQIGASTIHTVYNVSGSTSAYDISSGLSYTQTSSVFFLVKNIIGDNEANATLKYYPSGNNITIMDTFSNNSYSPIQQGVWKKDTWALFFCNGNNTVQLRCVFYDSVNINEIMNKLSILGIEDLPYYVVSSVSNDGKRATYNVADTTIYNGNSFYLKVPYYETSTDVRVTINRSSSYIKQGSDYVTESQVNGHLLKLRFNNNVFEVLELYNSDKLIPSFSDLSSVATSGSYNDLSDKPTIPSKTSDLTNDSGFLTNHQSLKTINNESLIGNGNIEISVGDNYGTFTELQTLINNTSNGSTLNLDKDYQCQNGENPIQVDNYININGNGHIIDGNNMSNIGMYGSTNLYNVKFINCHSDYNGGAVYVYGTIKIDNCLFMNNTSGGSGGALDFESDDSVVTNCVFINNKSQSNGGVLYSECEGYKFINCIFSNNSSDYNGGALWVAPYEDNNVTIKDCIFVDNTANGDGGGIYAYTHEEIKVYNCTFIESSLYNTRNVNYIAEDQPLISGKEDSSNKVSSWSSTPTDAHYPSEKLVKDYVDGLIGNAITYINQ